MSSAGAIEREQALGRSPRVYLDGVFGTMLAASRYAEEHPVPAGSASPVRTRETAHEQGHACSALSGEQPVFALLSYKDIQSLEGRLLTLVDASFSDREQRKAFKDLVRNAVWFDWVPNLDTDEPTRGKPDLR